MSELAAVFIIGFSAGTVFGAVLLGVFCASKLDRPKKTSQWPWTDEEISKGD